MVVFITLYLIAMSMLPDNVNDQKIPDTGISGVYEVFYATDDVAFAMAYFAEFGFTQVDSGKLSADEAFRLYGYRSGLTSYRLQNGDIDSHGLLRIIAWDTPKSDGVGMAPPRTIGQRFAVMMTEDIFRLHDIYTHARENGDPWLATYPVSDDLFDLDVDKKDFFQRPVIVRENAVYGQVFNHVFFQRYGYVIPGYGTVHENTPLRTSEFTHHDFFISADNMEDMSYLSSVLGLIPESDPSLDGEWQKGPKAVFQMEPGESHWYQGFVSPNNICGKLKFFIPTNETSDRSEQQTMGALGITMHSFYVDDVNQVHRAISDKGLNPSDVLTNELGEVCFAFTGPGGCSWQILNKPDVKNEPVKKLDLQLTKH